MRPVSSNPAESPPRSPGDGPIRVLEVIDHLGTGGAQVVLLRLLAGIEQTAYHPHVCCLHGDGPYLGQIKALGVPGYTLSRWRLDPLIPWRLARLLRTLRPDIVHLHLEVSTVLGVPLAQALTGARVVVSIYNLRNQFAAWVFPLLRAYAPWIDAYVVGGKSLDAEMRSAGFLTAKMRPIALLPTELTADLGDVEALRAAARRAEGVGPDTPVVLRVARLHPHKGYPLLLAAMARVVKAIPQSHLLIVGDGPQEHDLRRQVSHLGLARSVRFLGFRPALRDLYLASDVVVVASQREGVGLATVEAMACGRPVVACNVGGLAEVIKHGETGLLVPPDDPAALGDAIVALLGDKERRQALGAAAQAFVRSEYSVPRMVAEHERLYSDLARAPI